MMRPVIRLVFAGKLPIGLLHRLHGRTIGPCILTSFGAERIGPDVYWYDIEAHISQTTVRVKGGRTVRVYYRVRIMDALRFARAYFASYKSEEDYRYYSGLPTK